VASQSYLLLNSVELKTESLLKEGEDEESKDVEEDVDIDVDIWVALVMPVVGDILEHN
jgi:hypothetical protein